MSLTGVPDELNKTSAEVRSAFLEFFAARGHAVRERAARSAERSDADVRQRRHGPVQGRLHRQGDAPLHARDVEPEVHPHPRQAQRPRERRRHRAPPHVLRDARQLLASATTSRRTRSPSRGSSSRRSTASRRSASSSPSSAAQQGVPADDEARAIWRKVTGFGDDRILGTRAWPTTSGRWARPAPAARAPRSTGSTATRRRRPVRPLRRGADARRHGLDGDLEPRLHAVRALDRRRRADARRRCPKPCIDTGAGLERIASVAPGRDQQLRHRSAPRARRRRSRDLAASATAARMATTTSRCASSPTTRARRRSSSPRASSPIATGREYVLRRVMRRAIRHGHRLGIREPFLHEVALEVVDAHGRRSTPSSRERKRSHRERRRAGRGALPPDDRARPQDPRRGARPRCATRRRDASRRATSPSSSTTRTAFRSTSRRSSRASAASPSTSTGYERGARGAARAQRGLEGRRRGDRARLARGARRGRADGAGGCKFTGYEREEGEGEGRRDRRRTAQLVDRRARGRRASIVVTDVTPFYGEAGGQVGDRGHDRGAEPAHVRRRGHAEAASAGSSCTTAR